MDTQQPVPSLGSDPLLGVTGRASIPARPARTRSEIAKTNIRKGKERERNVAAFLRVNGFPGAERLVRTGFRNAGRTSHDEGDITGTPGIAWQIKDVAEREWYRVPKFMADAANQAKAAKADFGVLVCRRPGHAHPGEWWAHMYAADLLRLAAEADTLIALASGRRTRFAIRFELQDLIPLLRAAGYGTELDPSTEDLS